jgi:hypothetical protein
MIHALVQMSLRLLKNCSRPESWLVDEVLTLLDVDETYSNIPLYLQLLDILFVSKDFYSYVVSQMHLVIILHVM